MFQYRDFNECGQVELIPIQGRADQSKAKQLPGQLEHLWNVYVVRVHVGQNEKKRKKKSSLYKWVARLFSVGAAFLFLFVYLICFDNTIYIPYPYTNQIIASRHITSRHVASRLVNLGRYLFLLVGAQFILHTSQVVVARSRLIDRYVSFNICMCIQYHRHGMNHFHLRPGAKMTELCFFERINMNL